MKKLIFLLLLVACEESEYCWKCDQQTMITFERQKPVPHTAILEYCGKTEEDIKRVIIDGTWKSTLISQGDTTVYVVTMKCKKL